LIVGTALILIVPYWFTIGPRQASVLRVASLLAFLAVVAMRTGGDGSRYRLRVPDVAAICLVALVILSWVTDARDPHESLQLTLNAILPITFFFSVRCLGIEVTRPLLWCALLAGALASLSVFYELLLTHEPVFINARDYLWNARPGEIFRPGGVFGSPAAAAAVLSTTTLCGSALLRKTDGVQRLVVVACLALGAGATFATFTRAGVIGLAVGSVVADTAVAAAATGATVSFMVVSAAADSLRNPPSFVAIAIATGLLGIASSRNREAAVDDGGDSSE
jgi:hypothetical protein